MMNLKSDPEVPQGESPLPITSVPKSGREPIHQDGNSVGPSLSDFWRWSTSDLVNNTTRGILAEYLVATALGINQGVRPSWDAHDLTTPDGLKIEVKSSAYLQAWAQRKPSLIRFGIPETKAWIPASGLYEKESKRQADLYVFCLLHHQDRETLDPLNVAQWLFYVVPTSQLNLALGTRKFITLDGLVALGTQPIRYADLPGEVVRLSG